MNSHEQTTTKLRLQAHNKTPQFIKLSLVNFHELAMTYRAHGNSPNFMKLSHELS